VSRRAGWLLSGALGLAAALPARSATPVLVLEPDTLAADADGAWRTSLVVRNPLEWGLYPDSLFLDWRSLDDEPGSGPGSGSTPLTALVAAIEPASAGGSTGFLWTAPADFERGTLTFRLVAHDGRKQRHELAATAVVTGSELSAAHPSELLRAGGREAEVILVKPGGATAGAAAPGLVYAPAAGVRARSLLRWSRAFAARGQAIALVSLPGTGRSAGPADRAGPASVAAVEAALARLAREPGVDATRLALWGVGEGATAALLAAERHPELGGVVAQDASYDAWATYRALPDSARAAFAREAGRDSAGWRARSPLDAARRVRAPVLVLQTSEPGAPPAAPAEAYAAARAARGLPVESRIGGREPRPLLRRDTSRLAQDFLSRHLRKP
jgi:pimeloyl-ACP methyl ester carboxylesterase